MTPLRWDAVRHYNATSTSAIGALSGQLDSGRPYCLFSPQGGTTMHGTGLEAGVEAAAEAVEAVCR